SARTRTRGYVREELNMSQMPLFAVNEPVIDVAQHQARRRQRDEDATIEEAIAILERRLRSRRQESVAIKSMADAKSYLRLKLASCEHEVFACLLLDNQHRVIAFEELFRGTIDAASVYPREVVKLALARNAAALIVSHNHPSGVTNASRSDE